MAKKKELTPEEKLQQAIVPKEEQPYPLPEGWRWVRLESICEVIMGQSPNGVETTDDSSYIPLIGGAADMGELYLQPHQYTKKPTKISKADDLILCIRATLGRPNFADGEYCLGRGVAAIRSNLCSKEFLRYMFLNFEQYLYDNATGSTFLSIGSSALKSMPVPFPSQTEQIQIVEKINSYYQRLDEASKLIQHVLNLSEKRKAAILHKAFTGELTAKWRRENNISDESWIYKAINSICKFQYGTSKKSQKEGKMIVLRMGNLQNGEIDWTNLAYTSDEADIKKYLLKQGDVLFNRTNSPELVGKTAIYRGEYPAIYAGYLIKLEYNSEILGEYLNYVLNSPDAREYCYFVKSDGVSQSNINAQKIGEFIIPIPSIKEQEVIIREIHKIFTMESQIKRISEELIFRIDVMKKAILSKAFHGEYK